MDSKTPKEIFEILDWHKKELKENEEFIKEGPGQYAFAEDEIDLFTLIRNFHQERMFHWTSVLEKELNKKGLLT